jgi:hypothetical protein
MPQTVGTKTLELEEEARETDAAAMPIIILVLVKNIGGRD